MRALFAMAGAVFALDQIVKVYVVHVLDLAETLRLDVWPPYLNLRMAWNRGINFGLLPAEGDAGRWILIGVALAISAGVLVWMLRESHGIWARLSAGLLIGGALGNAVDRVIYGAVADFLNMSCCGIDNPYAFNVADIAIFAGALGLVVFTGRDKTP
ncbi:signal peptidase II [Rhodovulum adriaticum]|uniref:Lipoprotein signal peptidase n=1 Tax=Rhodovulum adriaticum TaxID=35804 RepID=A0A4R2NZW0_RHOAD|nr:signal peptidase II [Rhodovulum adriaticum]MBK1634293.1 signal peptidase II [Rhodovulum adriaticum]TCP27154.1 signal peptidase II [Rhodovulum adriaticum]